MPGESLQNSLVEWFVRDWPEWSVPVAKVFSHLGSEYFYLLLLPLLYWFGPLSTGLAAARAVVLADLLGEWVKWSFQWPRPPSNLALSSETSPGFVSTHAALSVALAVAVWRQWPKARPMLVLWVLGVGWSRLRLGVHYPLDVVGGWLLGIAVALLILRMKADSRRTLYLIGGAALVVAFLWPAGGGPAWQRDVGLLLGLELGVLMLQGQRPSPLGLLWGLGRLCVLVGAYIGLKTLGWAPLFRYFVLGVLVSLRARVKD